jgi:hypothetical protein
MSIFKELSKRSNILAYVLLVIMVGSLVAVLITKGNMIWVRIWLTSLGFLFIVAFSKFTEKAHKKGWSGGDTTDFSSLIIWTIIEFLPWWVIKWGGIIIGIIIIVFALFFL